MGGFDGMQVIDTTLKIICEICARSLGAPVPWDNAGVEADSGRLR